MTETIIDYLARREGEEILLAATASNQLKRDVHDALAREYRSELNRMRFALQQRQAHLPVLTVPR